MVRATMGGSAEWVASTYVADVGLRSSRSCSTDNGNGHAEADCLGRSCGVLQCSPMVAIGLDASSCLGDTDDQEPGVNLRTSSTSGSLSLTSWIDAQMRSESSVHLARRVGRYLCTLLCSVILDLEEPLNRYV